jgi:hypothetical protein
MFTINETWNALKKDFAIGLENASLEGMQDPTRNAGDRRPTRGAVGFPWFPYRSRDYSL